MAYTGPASELVSGELSALRSDAREPGARRRKLAGLVRAGRDVAQSYFSNDGGRECGGGGDDAGGFPDAAVVRNGNEEMILFPSYARKHAKSTVSGHGREYIRRD